MLLSDPLNVLNFARDSKNPCAPAVGGPPTAPGAVIKKIVQLLEHPIANPDAALRGDILFTFSSAEEVPVKEVLQAQMAGMLLSILLQLSFADDVELKQQLLEAEALQLLCKLAIGKTDHYHPSVVPRADSVQVQLLRPDVQAKLAELYK